MSAQVLSGKSLIREHEIYLQQRVSEFIDLSYGKVPHLVTVQIGEHAPSEKFIALKTKKGRDLGLEVTNIHLPETVGLWEVYDKLDLLGIRKEIHGIMVQHPLPHRLRPITQKLYDLIPVSKDVDGLTSMTLGRVFVGDDTLFYPSAARAVIRLLSYYQIPLIGKNVVIFGASNLLGKPLAAMLLQSKATVTVFNKDSRDETVKLLSRNADIVIGACGDPHFITSDFVADGAVLIDAGYTDGHGDIDPACYEKASAYTPVPGCIGPLTVNTLISQTVVAALESVKRQRT